MKKILILTSNPRNDLKLNREIKDLKNVIKRSQNQSQLEPEFELEVHPEELQDLLLGHEPRIVHFCCHGNGEQGLVLGNQAGGEQIVTTEALSNLFKLFDKEVECVLLNACYSEIQANKIVQYINYVVGMSHEIRDDAAIAFATGFYRALGWGRSIEESYQFGRNAIQIQIAEANSSRSRSYKESRQMVAVSVAEQVIIPEHLKPVLKKKSPLTPFPEAKIFVPSFNYPDSSTQSKFPPELVEAVKEEYSYKFYRDRTRETWDEFGQVEVVRQTLGQHEYRQRKTLLRKVKDFWIKGFLELSLYKNIDINLDFRSNPDAVFQPFESIKEIPVELDDSFEELQSTDILNQTGQGKTLLILGEPGSGKTITLLQLAKKLVNQTEQDLTKPIPVVFNLSSWGQKQQTIEEWLIEEFKDKYQVPKTWSEPWLKQEQLILLLDGLDEVKKEQRNACVQALNHFIETHNITEIAVCSRVEDYEALIERLRLSSAICIKPLSLKQLNSFLAKAGDSLAGLKSLLQQDLELEKFAQTPLILNIMSLAYQDWSAEDLLQQFRSGEDLYQHLFDSYIERMLHRRGSSQSQQNSNQLKYPKDKILHWLSWLAKVMTNESKTIFLIEDLQPNLLQSICEKISYRISNIILGGLIVGLIVGLSFGLLNLTTGLVFGLSSAFSGGIIGFGLLKGITLFEQINFAWLFSLQKTKYRIIFHSILALSLILILGLIQKQITYELLGIFIGVIIYMPIDFLVNSVVNSKLEIEKRTKPNQGIWLSRNNCLRLGLSGGLIGGLFWGLFVGLTVWLDKNLFEGIKFGFGAGLMSAILIGGLVGLRYGGAACMQHFNLRIILYFKGRTPRNYAHFLDYASERLLLKKVGGGYIFYHRMLMEHFAEKHQVSKR